MTTVRMRYGISGGRADGTDWPPAGGLLDVSDAEARDLVAGHLADYAEPEPEPEPPVPEPEPAAAVVIPPPAEPAPPPEVAAVAPPPVRAARQEWADHAVAQGADPAEVDEMTKAQLVGQFGASAATPPAVT
jgi:hypothetical protein